MVKEPKPVWDYVIADCGCCQAASATDIERGTTPCMGRLARNKLGRLRTIVKVIRRPDRPHHCTEPHAYDVDGLPIYCRDRVIVLGVKTVHAVIGLEIRGGQKGRPVEPYLVLADYPYPILGMTVRREVGDGFETIPYFQLAGSGH